MKRGGPRKYNGGEKVRVGRKTNNLWTICKTGHGYYTDHHLYYKIRRGPLVDYQRPDCMATV